MRFPEFTEEWAEYKLGDIIEFSKDRVSSSSLNEDNYVSTENMLQDFQGIVKSQGVPPNINVIAFKRGDILISNIRPYLKKVWKADREGGCSADVFVMRANPDFCEEDFLHHIIANERFISYVMSGAKGVKMPRGDKEQMKEYKTALPSKKEQLPISLLLSLLDERIISQSRAIEDLKRLRLAFQDKLIEQLVCSNDLKSFSEVYEVAGEGGTPDTSKREYYDGGTIPFIKIDDLANKYLKKHKDSITELGMQKSSAWLVPANSLIFSNGATIGAASINSYPVATKQGILGIVPKNNISVEYLYYLMTSTYFKKQVHRIITHGTMATAYLKDINKISVPIPSFDKQEYVSLVLSSLSGKEAIETQMLSQLQNQKQYLLQRMFI